MTEVWKDIAWATGYEVSSFGVVRSKDRLVISVRGTRSYAGKVLSPTRNQHGHLKVPIRFKVGKVRLCYIHSLVAEAFIGARPIVMQVAHNDGNHLNNHVSNFRYDTPKGNCADMKRHGTARLGADHPSAKLTEQEVSDIRVRIGRGDKQKSVAALYNVARTTISAISTGRSWRMACNANSNEPTIFVGRAQ